MPSYLIAVIHEVTDPDAYQRYTQRVPELVARHGGDYVVRTTYVELVEGPTTPHRILVLRFPDRAAVRAMFADPDYAAIADLRREASTGTILVVDGA